MSSRILYIAAYDVSEDRRLRQALMVLRNYATGGQKSVFKCFLSPAEKQSAYSTPFGRPFQTDSATQSTGTRPGGRSEATLAFGWQTGVAGWVNARWGQAV